MALYCDKCKKSTKGDTLGEKWWNEFGYVLCDKCKGDLKEFVDEWISED